MFISSFCSNLLIWVPVSFPSLLVPCTFSFISLFIAFTFSSNLQPYSTNSVSILITSVLNCASDRLAISSSLSCIFFWSFDLFFHLGHFFFVWACQLCSKGWNLRYWPGRGNPCSCVVVLPVGEGSEREQCHLLCSGLAFSHFLCYPQANWALLVLIPRWVGLCTF